MLAVIAIAAFASAQAVTPDLSGAGDPSAWTFSGGRWEIGGGVLSQLDPSAAESTLAQTGHAFVRGSAFDDFVLTFEFLVEEASPGVGAAEVLLRSTDSHTYTLAHFTTKASGVYLTHNRPGAFWENIQRAKGIPMPRGEWHEVRLQAGGTRIAIDVNAQRVIDTRDAIPRAGLIGFGSSQGICRYRNIRISGTTVDLVAPWRDLGGKLMPPDYRVICQDAGAGTYEAFPDICRCANGDLLCVFYAGYGHVAFPREGLPNGARVCSVRSTDDGLTWGPPAIVVDTPWDDRDPSITCLRDGTLICNWFTYYGGRDDGRPGCESKYKELWLSFSSDDGASWAEPHLVPHTAGAHWGCSSPIIELTDDTLLWPIYREYQEPLRNWSAVMRSTDGGRTWSDPAWVDETNDDNDEPALIERPDGTILCLMRANSGDSMWSSVSRDKGLTWSPSEKTSFPGHAPYLFYTDDGTLLLGHRLPNTALHYSTDDGESWSETYPLDSTIGAYPSMVRRNDGTVLIVYYEEGEGSSIRAQRLRVTKEGIKSIGWE